MFFDGNSSDKTHPKPFHIDGELSLEKQIENCSLKHKIKKSIHCNKTIVFSFIFSEILLLNRMVLAHENLVYI